MRILLDENMPRKLRAVLAAEGHDVESVRSLRLDGIDNGTLYELAAREYDLCFTRDAEFAKRVQEWLSSCPKRAALLSEEGNPDDGHSFNFYTIERV